MKRRTILCRWVIVSVALVWSVSLSARDLDKTQLSERAFEGAQWVLATQAARAVAQVGARVAAGDGPLGAKVRARQDIETRISKLRDAMSAESEQDRIVQDLRQANSDLAQIDAEIREEFPEYAEFSNPRPLGFADVQEHLGPTEALILFLSDRTATYVWAVSKEATAWHRSRLTASDLDERVRAIREDLDPTGPSRSAVSLSASTANIQRFEAEIAFELYQELIAPLSAVLDATENVFVVKDGALSSLPLSVLLTEDLGSDAFEPWELRDAPWLINRFAITTLPSVASLTNLGGGEAATSTDIRFLGFGNPDFAGSDEAPVQLAANRSIDAFFSASVSRTDAIRALAPLPGTARELRQIAKLFPDGKTTLRLGAAATEAEVKSTDLSRFSVISFATHGLITGDISGLAEPALAFTPPELASDTDDGLLTASEASELRLNADWVILSACNTASGDGTPGAEGLSGLARAFLFAGARSILVSHWPVRDDVAAVLTSDTLRRVREDTSLGRSQALRQSVIALMQDEERPDALAHPSAWAPFVLVGDGGAL